MAAGQSANQQQMSNPNKMMPLMKLNELERNKMQMIHHSQNQSSGAQGPGGQQQNSAAYDALKKRLLNEYKKLVSNKKSGSTNGPTMNQNN